METLAKFSSSADATQALELLQSRGIAAAIWPDEVSAGMWQGDRHHLVGYRLEVDPANFMLARECLQREGLICADEE